MRGVKYSKLVFLNSSDGTRGSKGLTPSFHIPTEAFSCDNDESIRLVLKNFTLARGCFYGINETNNTFFYRDTSTNADRKIVIAPGDYVGGSSLAAAITDAVNTVMGGVLFTCTYNTTTRLFTFNVPDTYPDGYFVSYFDKTRTHPHGSDNAMYYSDVHEVLGGSSSIVDGPTNMFLGAAHVSGGGVSTFVSKYPIRLQTIDTIYLRCSAQGDAFASTSFEHVKTGNKLEPTDVWASIPVNKSSELISMQDNSDDWQIHVKDKKITTLQFTLSDGKGRQLPVVASDQATSGNMSFKLSFKFEVMNDQHEAYVVKLPSGQYQHPPQMTR